MQPSNTLLAPSRFMSSDIRFVRSFVIVFVAFAALFLTACNQNEPTRGDETQKNQPANPSTWSPVGHKYVSTDEDYLNREITFISKDSFLWKREDHQKVYPYRIEYPIIYVWENESPWLKFVDTLTISRKSDLADESSCYKLVY